MKTPIKVDKKDKGPIRPKHETKEKKDKYPGMAPHVSKVTCK